MKFSEMQYERPDIDDVKRQMQAFTTKFAAAASFDEAKEILIALDKLKRHVSTLSVIVHIRHTIDTRDTFYDEEERFWNRVSPELEACETAFSKAMLASPFRADLEKEFGEVLFLNAELKEKAFSEAIIPDMQEENDLVQEYEKLLANGMVPFEGGRYTLSQMVAFKSDADDARRLAAWKAEGQWYKDHQEELDSLYDRLVKVRTKMAKTLGFSDYIPMGYCRMERNCYTKEDVERFRAAVVDYLVPVAERLFKAQAKRIGRPYPLSFADKELMFRSGNPRPKGDAEDILKAGTKFYDALSKETSEFWHRMIDDELLDLLSKEGKRGGGYMEQIPDYGVPFIFANFNGTEDDVETVTHEAGHAFAGFINADRVPEETLLPTMEGAEVHSMSMEFFAEEAAEDFFGEDAAKYRYAHLAGAITFIPYGAMVDHFQHSVYEHPEMTPKERHAEWKRLLSIYMPWMRLDGDIPFYAEGEGWQRQHHIYSMPFYYIDYCLAQTVALSFWARIAKDKDDAWAHYMAYTRLGGSLPFTGLLEKAGLPSPFDPGTLKDVCSKADAYLTGYDLTGIN